MFLNTGLLGWIDWEAKYFGVKIYDEDLVELMIRFAFNVLVSLVVIYFIYHKRYKKTNYTFTFFVFNVLIFFISYMMASVKLELGFAFGLFAIFSILRYRTDPVPIKEMTYLFAVISIAVINAITTEKVSYIELLTTNFMIIFVIYLVEKIWHTDSLNKMNIDLPNVEYAHTERQEELKNELIRITGLEVMKFEISSVDYAKGSMKIKIYYK